MNSTAHRRRSSRRRVATPGGFSLIEVMMSSVILLISLSALLALITGSANKASQSSYNVQVAKFAHEQLSARTMGDVNDSGATTGPLAFTDPWTPGTLPNGMNILSQVEVIDPTVDAPPAGFSLPQVVTPYRIVTVRVRRINSNTVYQQIGFAFPTSTP